MEYSLEKAFEKACISSENRYFRLHIQDFCSINCLAAIVAAAVSKSQKAVSAMAASIVFGIALLSESLSLLAEEIGAGRDISQPLTLNVCAPVVDAIYITNHGSSGLTAKVTLSSGGGWISFLLELGTDFSSKFLMQFGILIIFGVF